MLRHAVVRALVLMGFCLSPALSYSREYEKGLAAFQSGHNAEAAAYFLAAVRGADAQNPAARYYLASAFLRLSRVDEALHEFHTCLELKPDNEMASYCHQAIQYYEKAATPKLSPAAVFQNNALITPAPSSMEQAHAVPEIKIDPGKLPKIPSYTYAGPSIAEVQTWDYRRQADYLDCAQESYDLAVNQMDRLTSCRRRAEMAVNSQVPGQKAYGEDEAAFKARYDASARQAGDLLAPYKVAEEKQAGFVDLTRAITEMCTSAAGGFNKHMPTGCRRGGP